MSRTSRVVLTNYPHHVIHRGHNRQVIFARDKDYRYYLENVREFKEKLSCKIYAYCLMKNHVHLIIDPGEKEESLGLFMKGVAGRQTRFANKRHGRTGTLWDARYRSSPVDSDKYLLACCRYVELNPVRAGIVDDPGNYMWSSYRSKIGLEVNTWLDPDPYFGNLGGPEKVEEYQDWIKDPIHDSEINFIRQAVQRGQLTGSDSFIEKVGMRIGRKVEFRGRGRPRKK